MEKQTIHVALDIPEGMPKWKQAVKATGTNPEWGKMQLESIINELDNRNTPSIGYIKEHLRIFERFLDNDISMAVSGAWKKAEKVI